jgi:4-amino-4-deoxy-L-arabinose transferase-like glycosyltransferase
VRLPVLGGLLVALLAAVLLVWTAGDYGVVDDEPAYLKVEDRISEWFQKWGRGAFEAGALSEGFFFGRAENRNLPAPAILSVLGRSLAPRSVSPLLATRLGHCLLMAATLGLLFGTLAARRGLLVAGAAGLALLLMPHAFGHAHFNATDSPASCFLLLTLLFFPGKGKGSALLAGAFLGLGLATKASLFPLPLLLLAWALVAGQRSSLRSLVIVFPLGFLVFLALCPMWWHAPVSGLRDFLGASFGHAREIWVFDAFYLGKRYVGSLPWHNGIILPLVSTPPLTLALAFWGAFRGIARREAETWLWVLGAGFLPLLRMLPGSPGHDGVRLMLPSLFCLAPLAAFGLEALRASLRPAGLVAIALVGVLEIGLTHPFELSYYSEAIGGLPGAKGLGFEVSYWFDAFTPKALAEIQALLPPRARVWTYPSYPGFRLLRDWGLWRGDLSSGEGSADYLLLLNRRASLAERPELLRIHDREEPVYSLRLQGVQLVGLYRLSREADGRSSPQAPRSASRSEGMSRTASAASFGTSADP